MFEQEKVATTQSRWQEGLRMIKRHPYASTIVVILVLAAGLFLVFRPSLASSTSTPKPAAEQPKQEKKLPVEIAKAKLGSISSSIVTTASLEADSQVTIMSETTGVVRKLYVDEGTYVKEGQLLAELSDDDKQVALQKATVQYLTAKQDLDRKESSYRDKIISQADYDKSKSDMDVADAVKKAAEIELHRTQIRAPFSGVITERYIEKGQSIPIQAQLFTLVDRDPLEAKIYLPEKELVGVQENQTVDLSLNSEKGVDFQGTIKQINPAVDPKTGTVKVKVEVTKAPLAVRPGSFVDVRLVTQRHDNALLIPKKAILEEAGEQYVYAIYKDTAARRPVKIGFIDDVNAEVLSGLNTGDAIVIAGQGSLRDGAKAEVVATR